MFFLPKRNKKKLVTVPAETFNQEPTEHVFTTELKLTVRSTEHGHVGTVGFKGSYRITGPGDTPTHFHWKDFYKWFLSKDTPVFVFYHDTGITTVNRKDIVVTECTKWVKDNA